MGTTLSRNGRKKMVGKREDVARQRREDECAVLEEELHREFRSGPEDRSAFGYEPDDFDDEWDRRGEYE